MSSLIVVVVLNSFRFCVFVHPSEIVTDVRFAILKHNEGAAAFFVVVT